MVRRVRGCTNTSKEKNQHCFKKFSFTSSPIHSKQRQKTLILVFEATVQLYQIAFKIFFRALRILKVWRHEDWLHVKNCWKTHKWNWPYDSIIFLTKLEKNISKNYYNKSFPSSKTVMKSPTWETRRPNESHVSSALIFSIKSLSKVVIAGQNENE